MSVQKEIQEIYDTHGEVTPSLVFEAAKNPEAALHSKFEWDPEKGWLEYNLNLARQLIRKVEITVEGKQERLVHVPKVAREVGESREGYYKPPSVIVRQQSEFDRALSAALRQLSAAEESVSILQSAKDEPRFSEAASSISDAQEALRIA